MMLFEEFFKKKKINLAALHQDDEGLFSEFKDHYEQMGEKSFDHTKKYWFNKLRRRYPLPVEPKVDKFKAENQIAEQTVTDTLTEPSTRDQAPDLDKSDLSEENIPAAPAPKLGFKPKFKSASPVPPASAEEAPVKNTAENEKTPPAETPTNPAPKIGFKPRFKVGVTNNSKPTEDSPATAKPEPETLPDAADNTAPAEPTATPPKIGFKPRFKAGLTNTTPAQEIPQPPVEAPQEQEIKSDVPSENIASTTASEPVSPAKLGFKPRFKAGETTTKTTEETKAEAENPEIKETKGEEPAESSELPSTETPAPKLGFKPRFKAGVTSTKSAEEVVKTQEQETVNEEPNAPEKQQTEEKPAPKPAYKPRFTPNMVKRKPPEGE
jgi:hypothetical protein